MEKLTESRWYAIYTKSRTEKKTANELFKKGIEVYLPLVKTLRQWSDRKKKVELPLISSYLFIKTDNSRYFDILNTRGVVKYIGFSGKPVPIPEWQINNLRILTESGESFETNADNFIAGDNVIVDSGPLKGLQGTLVETRGKQKVVVQIDSLEHNFILNINPALLKHENNKKAG